MEELTAWLEADDAKGRARRARRLQDLLTIVPVPPEGMSFLGGEESVRCFEEVRRCYLDGSDMAVVLLSLSYVERELAAQLYAAGWGPAKKAPLRALLAEGYDCGVLSARDWGIYREVADLSTHRRNYNNVLLTAGRIFGYGCPESVSGNNHAEKKSFRDHAYRRGSTSAEAAGAKIYVAVFSGSTGPDDPLGRTRTAERRDCGAAQHAAGGRQPVAETVFPRTPAGT